MEGFIAATLKLESITGKAHVAEQAGRLIEGTVAQKFELFHGPHAMIETQRAFSFCRGKVIMHGSGGRAY